MVRHCFKSKHVLRASLLLSACKRVVSKQTSYFANIPPLFNTEISMNHGRFWGSAVDESGIWLEHIYQYLPEVGVAKLFYYNVTGVPKLVFTAQLNKG